MTIHINNIPWKIKFLPESNWDLRRDDGTWTIGMTDRNQSTIFLSNELEGALLYNVLCHELVHAFCFSYEIYMDEDDEERLAQFISDYGEEVVWYTKEILKEIAEK